MKVFSKTYKNLVIIVIFIFSSSFSVNEGYEKIGNQIWTTKNLAVDKFRNGEKIIESKSKEDWYKASYKGEPTWCYYMFDEKYSHLGKLYNYFAVSSHKNIAPVGWKVPTFFDYFELIKYLDPLISYEYLNGNGSLAGGSLKIKNTQYWEEKNCKQIDSKFNAIPSGGYSPSLSHPKYDWDKYGEVTRFWCITDWRKIIDAGDFDDKDKNLKKLKDGRFDDAAIVLRLSKNDCEISIDDDPKIYGYSLRLIKMISN